MTKEEFLKYLTVGPEDAEIVIADYVGDDMEIGDVIYFAEQKLFWIRTEDLVGELDDEIEDESQELSPRAVGALQDGFKVDDPTVVYVPLVKDTVRPRGKQRAA